MVHRALLLALCICTTATAEPTRFSFSGALTSFFDKITSFTTSTPSPTPVTPEERVAWQAYLTKLSLALKNLYLRIDAQHLEQEKKLTELYALTQLLMARMAQDTERWQALAHEIAPNSCPYPPE